MTSQGEVWSVLRILNWTTEYFQKKGIESARFEAECLLAHALDLQRIELYMHFDRPLMSDELSLFRSFIKRRAAHEPLAYIVGYRDFFEIRVKTDRRALIPRHDTETLLVRALALLKDGDRVIDIGTGTGVLALSIAAQRPSVQVDATDSSEQALDLARENALQLGLQERVRFYAGDLFAGAHGPYDLVLSNPPYIAEGEESEMGEDVLRFEPRTALFAGVDGLDVIRRIVSSAADYLSSGGHLLLEIGWKQAADVRSLLEESGYRELEVLQDLEGRDRVVLGRRPG